MRVLLSLWCLILLAKFNVLGQARGYLTELDVGCPNPRRYPDPRAPGGVRLERCRKNSCGHCGPKIALTTVNAMALSPLSQEGWITWPDPVDDPWAAARELSRGARCVVRRLRSSRPAVGAAWTVERSEAGRPHVHLVTRGGAVAAGRFREICSEAGLGRASIQAAERPTIQSCRYLLKTAMPVAGESVAEAATRLDQYLGLNAGRMVQTEGPFWRGPRGEPLTGIRKARSEARRAWLRTRDWEALEP
jgi:hypothetical protein